jgi:hypothetical protein
MPAAKRGVSTSFIKCYDGYSRRRSTTFPLTSYRNIDGDMWDDVRSGIVRLSFLILVLVRKYALNVLCGLG